MHYIKDSKGYYISQSGKAYRNGKEVGHLGKVGYRMLRVYYLDGTNKYSPIHRWVATTFIPNPEDKGHVNHIDGVKTNNHVSNLEWVTNQENCTHAVETGLIPKGEDRWNATPESVVRSICELLQDGMRICDIHKHTGESYALVKHIYNRNSWSHVSCEYHFSTKKREYISQETVEWICIKLEQGLKNRDICEQSDNDKVTTNVVDSIKYRKSHTLISSKFKF